MGIGKMSRPDTVLLVHADLASRTTVTDLLESHRYLVSGVATGAEGLRLLADDPTPCLILYVMTGAGDGSHEFRAAQMADPAFAAVPIIMCTEMDLGTGGTVRESFVQALLALVRRHCPQAEYAG
jgi:DNA-binding response OmpR family regulator